MASWINRGESVFFQFRNGKSVLNSQCKPRMFKTAEKATLGVNYIDTDDVVEYAEVVRCRDCVNGELFLNAQGAEYVVCSMDEHHVWLPNGFCSYGERKDGDG